MHQQLLATVTPLDPNRFKSRPAENQWSVAEIVHHLCLVERRVIKDLEKALDGQPQKVGFLRQFIPMSIVASRLVRVKSPKAVTPTNPPDKDEAIQNFEAARNGLKQLCSDNGKKRLRQIVFNHPFLGKIDGIAAISFVSYHELRHYKQIRELLKQS